MATDVYCIMVIRALCMKTITKHVTVNNEQEVYK